MQAPAIASTTVRLFAPLLVTIALSSCGHSESYLTGAYPITDPLTESSNQLTFNAGDDYIPRWSYDGKSVVYAYVDPGRPNASRCLGVVPEFAGTRLVTLCETRATHADSADSFAAGSIGPLGNLLYLQVTSKKGGIIPNSITLWVADTSAPLVQRRLLATFPIPVGDTTMNWLSEIVWQDPEHFVGLASTLGISGRYGSPIRDTIFSPHFLVRATISPTGAEFSRIPGTDSAVTWTPDERGDLLFVKGELSSDGIRIFALPQRSIYRVPPEGGTPTLVAEAPTTSLGITSITCHLNGCIALDRRKDCPPSQSQICGTTTLPIFYTLTLSTGEFRVWPGRINFNSAHIDPSGKFFVYARDGNLFRDDYPVLR